MCTSISNPHFFKILPIFQPSIEPDLNATFNHFQNVTGIGMIFSSTLTLNENLESLLKGIEDVSNNYNSTFPNIEALNAEFHKCYEDIIKACSQPSCTFKVRQTSKL